jgi:hypothetical protein
LNVTPGGTYSNHFAVKGLGSLPIIYFTPCSNKASVCPRYSGADKSVRRTVTPIALTKWVRLLWTKTAPWIVKAKTKDIAGTV